MLPMLATIADRHTKKRHSFYIVHFVEDDLSSFHLGLPNPSMASSYGYLRGMFQAGKILTFSTTYELSDFYPVAEPQVLATQITTNGLGPPRTTLRIFKGQFVSMEKNYQYDYVDAPKCVYKFHVVDEVLYEPSIFNSRVLWDLHEIRLNVGEDIFGQLQEVKTSTENSLLARELNKHMAFD